MAKGRRKPSETREFGAERRHMVLDPDGFDWRKYGEKSIHDPPRFRSYFRCSELKSQKCPALKFVDFCLPTQIHGPGTFVFYQRQHNHPPLTPTLRDPLPYHKVSLPPQIEYPCLPAAVKWIGEETGTGEGKREARGTPKKRKQQEIGPEYTSPPCGRADPLPPWQRTPPSTCKGHIDAQRKQSFPANKGGASCSESYGSSFFSPKGSNPGPACSLLGGYHTPSFPTLHHELAMAQHLQHERGTQEGEGLGLTHYPSELSLVCDHPSPAQEHPLSKTQRIGAPTHSGTVHAMSSWTSVKPRNPVPGEVTQLPGQEEVVRPCQGFWEPSSAPMDGYQCQGTPVAYSPPAYQSGLSIQEQSAHPWAHSPPAPLSFSVLSASPCSGVQQGQNLRAPYACEQTVSSVADTLNNTHGWGMPGVGCHLASAAGEHELSDCMVTQRQLSACSATNQWKNSSSQCEQQILPQELRFVLKQGGAVMAGGAFPGGSRSFGSGDHEVDGPDVFKSGKLPIGQRCRGDGWTVDEICNILDLS